MLRKTILMVTMCCTAAIISASAQQLVKQKAAAPTQQAQPASRAQLSKATVAPRPVTSLKKPATTPASSVAPKTTAAPQSAPSKPVPVQANVKTRKPLKERPAQVKRGQGIIAPASK